VDDLHASTNAAVVAGLAGIGFGDIALVPAPFLKHPKGIRDVEEWYISTVTRREHVRRIFERQCEIGIENLRRAHAAVGDKVHVLFVTGTDFGTQRGPFISPDAYRSLYKPFHKRVNDWVHENTRWKTFIHSCGGVEPLIADFVDAGFDILNPVQCSAEGMGPAHLKQTYGSELTFWGGGVDTQKTLPFGTPNEVRREVRERVEVFGKGGGFVFNAIHNMQANTPAENALAMFESFADSR
jgi:uroporphyrinogen-III decarboxylase